MKAWVLYGINDFRYCETAEPEPSNNEVIVKVERAGICGSDIPRIYENGAHNMPLITGHEFSGRVVRIGRNAEKKWYGKRVGVFPLIPCRDCFCCRRRSYEMCRGYSYLGSSKNGGFAEFAAVPEWNLIALPDEVGFEEAAMLEPVTVAVHAIRRIQPLPSESVVIYGLGTIGLLLTMLLVEKGIQNLFIIGNKDIQKKQALKMGIPESCYCDSRQQSIEGWVLSHTEGAGADVLYECVGKSENIAQTIDLAAPGGRICMVGNPCSDILLDKNIYWKILRRQLTITGTWNSSFTGDINDDWHYAMKKLQEKKIAPADMITHRYPMKEMEKGFHIMRDKTEDYIKIMMVQE